MEKKRQPNYTSDELEVLLSAVKKHNKVTVVLSCLRGAVPYNEGGV